MVMVTDPVWFRSGVSVAMRLEPLPSRRMAEFGINPGFDDDAVTTRSLGEVS